ncbi:MAG: tRNA uridine-5-carboxymethylaminomethyl(34) synthesis enzyme MnmG, partial [Steroidobacteraceae bacterium]
GVSAFDFLRRPEVSYARLLEIAGEPVWLTTGDEIDDRLPREAALQVEVRAKYSGYIERQLDEIERQRRSEETRLPDDLDYARIAGLSTEVRQRLAEARPMTLGQAGRLPGVTAAAISILLVHLKKRSRAA